MSRVFADLPGILTCNLGCVTLLHIATTVAQEAVWGVGYGDACCRGASLTGLSAAELPMPRVSRKQDDGRQAKWILGVCAGVGNTQQGLGADSADSAGLSTGPAGCPDVRALPDHGAPQQPLEPPYFWSDQRGVKIQFAGHAAGCDRLEIETGDPQDHNFLAIRPAPRGRAYRLL